jgi:hypothetical protein
MTYEYMAATGGIKHGHYSRYHRLACCATSATKTPSSNGSENFI